MQKKGVVLYLHVHQPWRVRPYSLFDVASNHDYFSGAPNADQDNEYLLHQVAEKSYKPMNRILESLLERYPEFRLSLSITGTLIEQAERFMPELLESFKRLVDTGRVEILSETYYHSLAYFYDRDEFEAQVEMHRNKIRDTFGVETQVFRNTELAYNNDVANWAEQAGFKGILAEGWDHVLGWRSPNYIYRPAGTERIALLMKNYKMSDDIAFRFSDRSWNAWPLTADKYSNWLDTAMQEASLVNLFMDYSVFGSHQHHSTGIFSFFERFVEEWLSRDDHTFHTASGAIDANEVQGDISVPHTVTWADTERDLSAWLGNDLQSEAMRHLYSLKNAVLSSGDLSIISDWRRLQSSDHTYYMSTKPSKDGAIHSHFRPYDSPHNAFLYYMNAIRDIHWRSTVGRGEASYD